ncbi:transglycosylase family protein [Propioniciclava soli]|uniref:transglycosylase family protein n=1 Tax=Propioniciclava soli TaxID=2775081 RepID=UPI0022B7A16E|nr:transglycosylase family protein [Propioniciclava soli]
MSMRRFVTRTTVTAAATGGLVLGGMVAAPSAQAFDLAVWDRVAQCESTGNWAINTGNGYYGGLQFSASTWRAYGGAEYASYAHQASKAQQIAIARRTLAAQGPGAWPTCSRRAGLTRDNGGADRNAVPVDSGSAPSRGVDRPPVPAPAPAPATGKLAEDGKLGPATTRALQRWVGASPDGRWGPATTRALQAKVGARVDGRRGPETTRKTQALIGHPQTGVWGSSTTLALQRYLNQQG